MDSDDIVLNLLSKRVNAKARERIKDPTTRLTDLGINSLALLLALTEYGEMIGVDLAKVGGDMSQLQTVGDLTTSARQLASTLKTPS